MCNNPMCLKVKSHDLGAMHRKEITKCNHVQVKSRISRK